MPPEVHLTGDQGSSAAGGWVVCHGGSRREDREARRRMVGMTATHGVEDSLARSVSRQNGVGRMKLIAVALDAGELPRRRCRTWWGRALPRDLVRLATV